MEDGGARGEKGVTCAVVRGKQEAWQRRRGGPSPARWRGGREGSQPVGITTNATRCTPLEGNGGGGPLARTVYLAETPSTHC